MDTIKIRLGKTRNLTHLKICGLFLRVNKSRFSKAIRTLYEPSHDEILSCFQPLDPARVGTVEDARKRIGKLFRGIMLIIVKLRHLVAHGALSADRANKLGLILCCAAAPSILHEVTGTIKQTLISKPQTKHHE